jgi:CRISPR-associated protein Csx3
MGRYFTASATSEGNGITRVNIGFGESASNSEIIPDAVAGLAALQLAGGRGIHFNGRASLPVAMAIAHAVAHLYGYVACYDPKLQGYVVAISHDPAFRPGLVLPAPPE